jgi:DNA-directed RNA polymerase subunit RPC12/RpoP
MPTKLKKSADGRLFVVYECPDCGADLRSKAEDIGQSNRCKSCGGHLTIPGNDLYQAYLKSIEPSQQTPGPPPSVSSPGLNLGIGDDFESFDAPAPRPTRAPSQPRPRPKPPRIVTLDNERDSIEDDDQYGHSDRDYLSLTTVAGESITLRFGPATAAVVGLQVIVGLGVLLWLVLVIGVILNGRNDFRDRPGIALGGTIITAVYSFCILVLPWLIALLSIWNRKYVITDRRILSQSGLAGLNVKEIRTESVSGLSVRQSFFARLFGFGSLSIFADGTSLRIYCVDRPIAIAAAVRSVIESG